MGGLISRDVLKGTVYERDRAVVLGCDTNGAEDGMDIQAVEGYMGQMGIKPPDWKIIRQDQLSSLIEQLSNQGFIDKLNSGLESIFYFPGNFAFVVRNPQMEELNGPAFTEGMLVEEFYHGASPTRNILALKGDLKEYYFPEQGFMRVSTDGEEEWRVLEEAAANSIAIGYLKQKSSDDDLLFPGDHTSLPKVAGYSLPGYCFTRTKNGGQEIIFKPDELRILGHCMQLMCGRSKAIEEMIKHSRSQNLPLAREAVASVHELTYKLGGQIGDVLRYGRVDMATAISFLDLVSGI